MRLIAAEARNLGKKVLAFSTFFYERLIQGSHFGVKGYTKEVSKVNLYDLPT